MTSDVRGPVICSMLTVPDAPAAVERYMPALGARRLGSLPSLP